MNAKSQDSVLLLVDAHALIYRAFYAFPGLTDPQGRLINAVYGFSRILLTAIRDFEPEYIAIAFDHKEKTFRAKAFEDYKANRAEMPDELKPQIDVVKQVVDALNIPRFEIAGFEADDLIGTLSLQTHKQKPITNNLSVIILTGDKDMLQLVDDQVHVFIPSRSKNKGDIEYDTETVEKLIGVKPNQITDMKALMGDASDNIPGVKGVGSKTAVKLVQTFGNLEKLYEQVSNFELRVTSNEKRQYTDLLKGALLQKLIDGKQSAYMSKELATINRGAPIKLDLTACRINGYNKNEAAQLFEELGFKSLIKILPKDDFELGLQEALF